MASHDCYLNGDLRLKPNVTIEQVLSAIEESGLEDELRGANLDSILAEGELLLEDGRLSLSSLPIFGDGGFLNEEVEAFCDFLGDMVAEPGHLVMIDDDTGSDDKSSVYYVGADEQYRKRAQVEYAIEKLVESLGNSLTRESIDEILVFIRSLPLTDSGAS